MKKLSLFAIAIATMGLLFTSCDKKNNGSNSGNSGFDNLVENGFYVAGDAVGSADLNVINQFAPGRNEDDNNALRDGMYEKYVILEANKDFEFIKKEGSNQVRYGANLEYGDQLLVTDNQNVAGYKGSLAQNVKMQVKEAGLYHIVLDFDEDKERSLKNVGGAQIVIAKIDGWGIGGNNNNWGYMPNTKADGMTWTWEGVEFAADGMFKFKNLNAWKLQLDDAGLVKANTNIGADGVPGGDNITVPEAGVYTITLTFAVAKGDIGNSFKYTVTRTGDVQFKDYSNVELELVGKAVADQEGAKKDESSWNWGNVISMGKPVLSGDVFTWTLENVSLVAKDAENNKAGFKVRTVGNQPQGGFDAFDFGAGETNSDDATVEADGKYIVIATINGKNGAKSLEIISADAKAITVTADVPAEWTKCYLWAWYVEDGKDVNIFSAWPGEELEIKDGKVSYKFLPTITKVNVIFNNGVDAQTNDIKDIVEDTNVAIADNLKK